VWTHKEVISAPEDLPPPATLPYGKKLPALPPSTLRSRDRLLRTSDKAVKVAQAGQSYNPTLEDWEEIIERTATEEQKRLEDIARKEWVPEPEDIETPHPDQESSDEETEEETKETCLRKPVQVKRKTRAQRNKEARQIEQARLRQIAEKAKAKRKQVDNLPAILSQISKTSSRLRTKKVKELPTAPLEVQLSDELAESLRLLKPEGNLFRDRYRSMVERGIVEPRFRPVKRGRRYPLKYVEKYDYKHWGKYYQK
jgi:nucleolar protein 53